MSPGSQAGRPCVIRAFGPTRLHLAQKRKATAVRTKQDSANRANRFHPGFVNRLLARRWPATTTIVFGHGRLGSRRSPMITSYPEYLGVAPAPAPRIQADSSKGLLKKQTAPPFIARSRICCSGNAVMKMTGVLWPCAIKCSCSSTPLMPGICTSAIRQVVSIIRGDDRNSCAEANACAEKPSALSKRAVAVRTEASSSTIEITGTSSTRLTFVRGGRPRSHPRYGAAQDTMKIHGGRSILRFRGVLAWCTARGLPSAPHLALL
jgi:hypothetical protein